MAANLSVLTHPYTTPDPPDFGICDRRYGVKLDIPQCDVAAGRLDFGSASTEYRISDQEGLHTLPRSIEYGQSSHSSPTLARKADNRHSGNCMVSVEVAGPHLPQTYTVVPDAVGSLAGHIINECVGRAGREGGFATMDIGELIDYVVDPSTELERYRKETVSSF